MLLKKVYLDRKHNLNIRREVIGGETAYNKCIYM